jgi:2-C-methyl-D-erythritol 4-phosphate cytidylyltransferase
MCTITAILLAGGNGSRMQSAIPKQYLKLQGKEIVLYSFERLLLSPLIDEICVVCDESYRELFQSERKPLHFASPGKRRQDSVWNGLMTVSPSSEIVCVHDSARPFITEKMIEDVITGAKKYGAATTAVQVIPTIKSVTADHFVENTYDRKSLREIQTPQASVISILKQGYAIAAQTDASVTDCMSLVELTGNPVKIVEGNHRNMKITAPEDLQISEVLI